MSYHMTTQVSWNQTLQELSDTFRLWGITEWAVNNPRGARWEGYREQTMVDRTVRLTYYKNDKPITVEMGKQRRAVDNLRVIYLAMDAMRLNEKRGVDEVLQSAYAQLQAPKQEQTPWELLNILPDSPLAVAEAAYKEKVKKAHPDAGGTADQMIQLNKAIEKIRKGDA